MNNIFISAIEDFKNEGIKITGVIDLLVRGSCCDSKGALNHWSDIDLSIVVKELNSNVHSQIKHMYQRLKKKYSIKISLTIISKKDLHSLYHHHGVKPIYYNILLQRSSSLINNKLLSKGNDISTVEVASQLPILKIDCFSNIAYLIHDIRNRNLSCKDHIKAKQEYCLHLLKRGTHLIRNSIYIKTGEISENINPDTLGSCFPYISKNDLLNKLVFYKSNWESIRKDLKAINVIVNEMIDILEIIYEDISEYMSTCFNYPNK